MSCIEYESHMFGIADHIMNNSLVSLSLSSSIVFGQSMDVPVEASAPRVAASLLQL